MLRARNVCGFLGVDKPTGITSFEVVRRIKGKMPSAVKVGHCGTLDPEASGVLVVALGSATRLIPYLPSRNKVYAAEVRFGVRTTSDDSDGEVVRRRPLPGIDAAAVDEALQRIVSEGVQIPPNVSALHSAGKRRHDMARSGELPQAPLEARPTGPLSAEVLSVCEAGPFPSAVFTLTCSRGTYVRAIARDLGIRLRRGAAGERPHHAADMGQEAVAREARKILFPRETAPDLHLVWAFRRDGAAEAAEGAAPAETAAAAAMMEDEVETACAVARPHNGWVPSRLDAGAVDASLIALRRVASDGFATADCPAPARLGVHPLRVASLEATEAALAEAAGGRETVPRDRLQSLLVPPEHVLGPQPTAMLYGPVLRSIMRGNPVDVPLSALDVPSGEELRPGDVVVVGDADGTRVTAMARVCSPAPVNVEEWTIGNVPARHAAPELGAASAAPTLRLRASIVVEPVPV